jgi:DNA repair exonuclease SbcCD ATPase subunit
VAVACATLAAVAVSRTYSAYTDSLRVLTDSERTLTTEKVQLQKEIQDARDDSAKELAAQEKAATEQASKLNDCATTLTSIARSLEDQQKLKLSTEQQLKRAQSGAAEATRAAQAARSAAQGADQQARDANADAARQASLAQTAADEAASLQLRVNQLQQSAAATGGALQTCMASVHDLQASLDSTKGTLRDTRAELSACNASGAGGAPPMAPVPQTVKVVYSSASADARKAAEAMQTKLTSLGYSTTIADSDLSEVSSKKSPGTRALAARSKNIVDAFAKDAGLSDEEKGWQVDALLPQDFQVIFF